MPLPAGRHSDPSSMVGKPLPTSFNRDVPQEVVRVLLDHDSHRMTSLYANPREFHQTDEKPQVSRSQQGRNSGPRLLGGGGMTRHVSRVPPSDAGSARWRVEVVRGALFKRIEEEKGLGGWAPAPRRGIRTVGIPDSAIKDHRPDSAAALGAGHQGQHQRRARHPRPRRPARPGPVGQDPVRHGHPDPAQRLLRPAHPEELPARQRPPDLPGLPVRAGVLARAAPAAAPHAHFHPGGCRERPGPSRGDEPAGPHQPGQDDQRNRERQRTGGCRCGPTTPATSSRPPAAAPSRPASAPSPPLRRMDATGQRITFDAVSRAAGVSRSWLYAQPDLRAQIQRLRQRHPGTPPPQVPPQRQRASDTSLLRRLEAATARIRRIRGRRPVPAQVRFGAAAEALGRLDDDGRLHSLAGDMTSAHDASSWVSGDHAHRLPAPDRDVRDHDLGCNWPALLQDGLNSPPFTALLIGA